MSDVVPADKIEGIVGAPRHPTQHLARAVSAERVVYILHSAKCLSSGVDLRNCPFSVALDEGINLPDWAEDVPLVVGVANDLLVVEDWPAVAQPGGES